MYGNVTDNEGDMNGKRNQRIETERPITKPDYPLPTLFCPTKRSELPTKREPKNSDTMRERAHFYRKRSNGSGAPIYGFYITNDGAERENPSSKH